MTDETRGPEINRPHSYGLDTAKADGRQSAYMYIMITRLPRTIPVVISIIVKDPRPDMEGDMAESARRVDQDVMKLKSLPFRHLLVSDTPTDSLFTYPESEPRQLLDLLKEKNLITEDDHAKLVFRADRIAQKPMKPGNAPSITPE